MAEFIQVATIMRKLFVADALPWPSLVTESNLEALRLRYKFNELAHQANNPAIGIPPQIFSPKGEFVLDGAPLLIEQFAIQPAILQFQVAGDSDQADRLAADLEDFISQIDPPKGDSERQELTKTYQTIAVVKLSVPFEAIFSDKFSRFLKEIVTPNIQPEKAEAELRLLNLRWSALYKPETTDFTYLPKLLAIEPRQGSRLGDLVYYTQSPTDYKTHKSLVEAFEKALS